MTSPAVRLWYAVLVAFLSALLIAGVSVQYANHTAAELRKEQRESDRKWCALLSTIDEGYKTAPPATPGARVFAAQIAKLRTDFGCD